MPDPQISATSRAAELLCACIEHLQAGEDEAALACLDQILAEHPQLLAARFKRATLRNSLRRHAEALADLDACLALQPDSAELIELRAITLELALAQQTARLQATPDDAEAWFTRGNLYLASQAPAAACADFRAALRLAPNHPGALNHLGCALLADNRHAEALCTYQQLLALAPEDPRIWFNQGNVQQQSGQLAAAEASYRRAITLQADFAEAYVELAHCQLQAGNYADGWTNYAWRWQTPQLRQSRLASAQPEWHGDQLVAGRTVLLWAEQGYGDTIQCVRFVREVAALGARVILRVPASLRALCASLEARCELLDEQAPIPAHDFHCPLLSLPRALGVRLASLSAAPAYLHADPARVAAWRDRLGPARRPRFGLVWAGRPYGIRNLTRDMPLAALRPLFALDADFISLQPHTPAADATLAASLPNLYPFGAQLSDFADTAALIENLDAVISVDTAVAHLAGALARPCHVLLRAAGEWRWLQARPDSPWYPSLRLHRQDRPGDWTRAVAALCAELRPSLASPA